jgi:hypothetical protein
MALVLPEEPRKIPTASPASSLIWSFTELSGGRFCHGVSTVSGPLPTAPISTDRGSTAREPVVLQDFLLAASYCGRCGRYSGQLY